MSKKGLIILLSSVAVLFVLGLGTAIWAKSLNALLPFRMATPTTESKVVANCSYTPTESEMQAIIKESYLHAVQMNIGFPDQTEATTEATATATPVSSLLIPSAKAAESLKDQADTIWGGIINRGDKFDQDSLDAAMASALSYLKDFAKLGNCVTSATIDLEGAWYERFVWDSKAGSKAAIFVNIDSIILSTTTWGEKGGSCGEIAQTVNMAGPKFWLVNDRDAKGKEIWVSVDNGSSYKSKDGQTRDYGFVTNPDTQKQEPGVPKGMRRDDPTYKDGVSSYRYSLSTKLTLPVTPLTDDQKAKCCNKTTGVSEIKPAPADATVKEPTTCATQTEAPLTCEQKAYPMAHDAYKAIFGKDYVEDSSGGGLPVQKPWDSTSVGKQIIAMLKWMCQDSTICGMNLSKIGISMDNGTLTISLVLSNGQTQHYHWNGSKLVRQNDDGPGHNDYVASLSGDKDFFKDMFEDCNPATPTVNSTPIVQATPTVVCPGNVPPTCTTSGCSCLTATGIVPR